MLRLGIMGKLVVFFLLIICGSGRAQVEEIGVYYSVIPFSRPIILQKSNIVGIHVGFQAKNKISISTFAFYGTNCFHSNFTMYNSQTVSFAHGHEIVTSFSGTEFGLGSCIYYGFFTKAKFTMSSGIGAYVSFYTKAIADYGTIFQDTLEGIYQVKLNTRSTNNFANLRDNFQDVILLNMSLKLKYSFTKRLSIYAEPFTSIYAWYKTDNSLFPCLGANAGLTWKIKNKAAKH